MQDAKRITVVAFFKRRGLPKSESGTMTNRCRIFQCVSSKGFETCADCSDFLCDNLQPFADVAAVLPHNTLVFILALIKKMGVEKWAHACYTLQGSI